MLPSASAPPLHRAHWADRVQAVRLVGRAPPQFPKCLDARRGQCELVVRVLGLAGAFITFSMGKPPAARNRHTSSAAACSW